MPYKTCVKDSQNFEKVESNIFSIILYSFFFRCLRRNGRHLVMHVRDPKVQRSDFITSSLLHNEHPKFSLFKLDKHIILGVTNNLDS